jgi:hypothetical protein
MKALLILTAIVEAGAGLALLGFPSETSSLLLGAPIDRAAALSLVRVGGAAVLGLAIACWQGRHDENSPALRGLVASMLFYNVAVGAVLALASIADELHGLLLWPAVVFHAAMGIWCIMSLRREGQGVLR